VKHEFDMPRGLIIIDKLLKFLSYSSDPACFTIVADIDSKCCDIVKASTISERDAKDRVVV
jgi:hypothetical protein